MLPANIHLWNQQTLTRSSDAHLSTPACTRAERTSLGLSVGLSVNFVAAPSIFVAFRTDTPGCAETSLVTHPVRIKLTNEQTPPGGEPGGAWKPSDERCYELIR